MTLPIGNYIYICSGSLVNNTAEDLKPYILSAFHCIDLDVPVTEENLSSTYKCNFLGADNKQ